jgi:hypothetical protein
MSWMMIAAIVAAGTVATFTDWLFMGVLFHQHYSRYPEVWWESFREKGDRKAIIYSSVLAYVTAASVILLCLIAKTHGFAEAMELSVLAWIGGPFVVVITNGFWIKIDPRVTFAHALGYLARFVIAGTAVGLILR